MRETQQAILEIIKRRSSATVAELSTMVSISPVTVRHHLYTLMADGLVERTPVREGVGRPEHHYSLTDSGRRRFPSRYHTLTTHLLSVLKEQRAGVDIAGILETIVRQLLALPQGQDGLSPAQRLRQFEAHLQAHDIPIRIRVIADEAAQMEMGCPYYHVSQYHPELCAIDQKVIGDILQMPMHRTSCLLDGDKSCTFSIELTEMTPSSMPNEPGSE